MQKSYWLLLVFLLLPQAAFAQVGTCEPALAEAYLDAGNVRARILNNGGLFWRGSPHVYEVGGAHSIFAAGIWVSGMINDSLRTAASRYGSWEFWAGPLDTDGNPPASCKEFDQIWEITKADITAFKRTGAVSTNLKNWPWHLGAPVVDGDNTPGNYNLAAGDLPELYGDQRLWWIMNDRGNIHEATKSEPIGLVVHGSAHAFTHLGFVGNSTFYEYKLINKNKATFEQAFLGLFSDADLGNFDDDYVGSDSMLHLNYTYNGDNYDEGSEGYGLAPPALGYTFFETISASTDLIDNDRDGDIDEPDEMLGAHAMMFFYGGGSVMGEPQRNPHYYEIMRGNWRDGSPLYRGLGGYNWEGDSTAAHLPLETTRFYFSGDPVTASFWSELNTDNRGEIKRPADRRTAMSTGPFAIASGDTATIRFAIVWSRGKDNLDSVTELKKDVRAIRGTADAFYTPISVTIQPEDLPQTPSYALGFDQNFPNPFAQSTTLRYSLPQTMQVRLAVYDMLGREVALLVDGQQEAGIHTAAFDAGSLPAGIYLARIELDFLRFTKRMVLIR